MRNPLHCIIAAELLLRQKKEVIANITHNELTSILSTITQLEYPDRTFQTNNKSFKNPSVDTISADPRPTLSQF